MIVVPSNTAKGLNAFDAVSVSAGDITDSSVTFTHNAGTEARKAIAFVFYKAYSGDLTSASVSYGGTTLTLQSTGTVGTKALKSFHLPSAILAGGATSVTIAFAGTTRTARYVLLTYKNSSSSWNREQWSSTTTSTFYNQLVTVFAMTSTEIGVVGSISEQANTITVNSSPGVVSVRHNLGDFVVSDVVGSNTVSGTWSTATKSYSQTFSVR